MSTWFGLTFICRIHLEKLLQQESIAIIEFLQYLQTNQCTSFHRSIRATDDWQHPFVISLCKSSFRQLHYSSSSLWARCRWMLTAASLLDIQYGGQSRANVIVDSDQSTVCSTWHNRRSQRRLRPSILWSIVISQVQLHCFRSFSSQLFYWVVNFNQLSL